MKKIVVTRTPINAKYLPRSQILRLGTYNMYEDFEINECSWTSWYTQI